LVQPAIRVAAAGLGAAVAGPLGAAVGGWLAGALTGPAADLIGEYAGKFGEKAGKKFLELGGESLTEKLKEQARVLDDVFRQALRLALNDVHKRSRWEGFDDWFTNWNRCLAASTPLNLPPLSPHQLAPHELDGLFRSTLERLDAQGSALQQRSTSLSLRTRTIPDALATRLAADLPVYVQEKFSSLIAKPEYSEAWKEAELSFQGLVTTTLARIDETGQRVESKIDALPGQIKIELRRLLDEAISEGRAGALQANDFKAKDAEITRLTEELRKLREQVAEWADDPVEADLSDLLAAGDLDGALTLKTKQVETGIHQRAEQTERLARDQFELGNIYELRSDWQKALDAYREAWRLKPDETYGFKYAYYAQRQNRFSEAIRAYESLLKTLEDPAAVARTLNNLAALYSATQRMNEAETTYLEALSTRRALAQANPDAYLPDVAATLNNLAALYSDTQRMYEAETAYQEALSTRRALAQANPDAYLPDVAATLNNLAILYSVTQRMKEANTAYLEALSTRRALAQANPDDYLPDVAMTLNNLAILYSDTQRMDEAETAYLEALSKYRALAQTNPDAHLPDVAMTLNNLANLYRDTQWMDEAETAYLEALSKYRALAHANPDAYLPDVAGTLNNLAILYHATQRMKEAESYCREAAEILEPLWTTNPELHRDQMARILITRAILCAPDGQPNQDACASAQRALQTAYNSDLKRTIEGLIGQFCGGA
jgi:tetratricopeptide (TPR) repeat protein